MKHLVLLLPLLMSHLVVAQNNYVANTANSATPGNNNKLVGPSAGNNTMTGTENSFFGHNSGSVTPQVLKTHFGNFSGSSNTTSTLNIFVAGSDNDAVTTHPL
ncbi:hypothetical protein [Spirosoma luteum]|uniref:hypothetical protein n=1 Tax=Spirosoma luteum TaxID=431553 RepID=UPI00047551FB|nr:hypothetical protein [Spirosoma luteum]